MPHHLTKSCPICDHNEFSEFLTCTDFFTTGETFDLKRCKNCGFLFTQNFPSEAIIGKYYEVPDYVSHSDTKTGIVNYLYHSARKLMLKLKANRVIKSSGVQTGTVLDYGCGTGYFVREMESRSWNSIGIEKSYAAREFAQSAFNSTFYEPEYLMSVADESCDVVTLWHVLEHVEHLDLLIEQLKRVLKPNGVLVLALPNAESFDAKYYREYWAAYDVPRHLWHFSAKTVSLLCDKHTLKLVDSKGMPLDAFYISMLSEKNRGARFSFLKGMWVGAHAFVSSLSDKSKYSSMIYIIKK
ncbi:MAG: class I SAM-dependent methyltransferase [Bacteroidales bacterium]